MWGEADSRVRTLAASRRLISLRFSFAYLVFAFSWVRPEFAMYQGMLQGECCSTKQIHISNKC